MLAGTASLNNDRETHLLDAMRILHDVWNEMEVSTIARCWEKSKILTPVMNAYIVAEYASRTKCAILQETKDLVNSIVDTFSKISLLTKYPFSESLSENMFVLASLQKALSYE